jgi:von Willebrand factor type A domain
MARTFQNLERASWFADANAVLASAVCHLVGMIALGLACVSMERGPQITLQAIAADEPVDAESDDTWLEDGIELGAAGDTAAAIGPARLFDVPAISAADFASVVEAPLEVAVEESGLTGTAFGDYGDEDGRLPGTSQFFGIGGYGRSFVYVVDCSGSMNEDGKFWRAIYELMRSIESLESDQTYYVFFYNHMAYPMDAKAPVAATEEHLEETRDWVEAVEPQGGTNPLPALLAALSLKPDAIYFLSDGRFDPNAATQVRAKNRPKKGTRIPIHSIAFVNRDTLRLMRMIAQGSGGEFRFVE